MTALQRHIIILTSLIFILANVSSSTADTSSVPRGIIGDGWADVVLGKPDFNSLAPNEVTGSRIFNGGGVIVDRSVRPNRLYVYDGGNSRVLGLSHLGTCSSGSNAGQKCTTDSDCPQSSCNIEEGRGADLVIGQPDFSSSGCNGDSNFLNYPTRAPASASTLCGMIETQVSPLEGGSMANMIEIYDLPLSNGDWPSDKISNPLSTLDDGVTMMQLTRKVKATLPGAIMGSALNANKTEWGWNLHTGDIAITKDAKYLWISDSENSRVLRVRDPLTQPIVDIVLGQNDITGNQCNRGMYFPTASTLCYPGHISLDSFENLYVADHSLEVRGNFRLLRFDSSLFPDQPEQMIFDLPASHVYEPTTFFSPDSCISEYCGPWEAAFDLYGRMYLGYNSYTGSPFPHFYEDPENDLLPTGRLNDYFSMAFTTFVDQENNLYIGDLNRGRVLMERCTCITAISMTCS
ncbi:MAG: hypothetical protein GX491_14455 [Chloroflexi bacterium]|nr:hypothetical protein [Chloroflexota bacterium]